MSKKLTLLFILLGLIRYTSAQQVVSGNVTDSTGKPILYATASLLKAADSTLVRSSLTGEEGLYQLDSIVPGRYLLRLYSIGYQPQYTPVFELLLNRLPKIIDTQILHENSKPLNEVVIRGDRRQVRQRADGTVVNVENSLISKGSSVLEVLERSPGVIIDHQNNGIMLNGKNGVMVMLNGKPMRMALDQVVRMLGGMNANDIAKVELLTSPSVAYDAEGSAGLINIVTKKSSIEGTNGSVSLTAGYGYGEKTTGSLSLNHNTERTNLYGSYNYSRDKAYSDFHAIGTEQEPLLGGMASSDFLGTDKLLFNNHQVGAGIDLKLNKSLMIGGSINYNNSNTTVHTVNKGTYLVGQDNIYNLNASVNGVNHWRNLTSGIYAEQQFKKGDKVSLNIDYINYKNNYPIDVQSSFLDQNGNQAGSNDTLFSPLSRGLSNTLIRIWSPKFDYTRQLSDKIGLETGLKGTQTRTNSISAIQSLVNEDYVSRSAAMNNILMKEQIGAVYGSLKVILNSSTEIVGGLRYEYSDTRMDDPLAGLTIADRHLGVWFPNLQFSGKLNTDVEWLLSYSKRISRPSYSDLASYITYNGPGSVNTGNPLLKPTITNNLKLGYIDHGYAFSVLLSRDKHPIARHQIVYTADKQQMAVSPQNLIFQDNLTFQANIPLSPARWWTMNYNLNAGWHRFKLDYTPEPASKTYFSSNLNTSNVFRLPADISIELSGYYNSGFYNGSKKVDGYGVLNAGIRKTLKKDGGTFQVSFVDVLQTGTITSYFGALTAEAFELKSHVDFHPESSKYLIVKMSYTKSFGSATTSHQRKRGKAAADEIERITP